MKRLLILPVLLLLVGNPASSADLQMKYLLLIMALNTSEGTATTTIPMADEIACNQAITQIKQQIYDKFAWVIEDADEPGNEAIDFEAVALIAIANATPVMLCVKQ